MKAEERREKQMKAEERRNWQLDPLYLVGATFKAVESGPHRCPFSIAPSVLRCNDHARSQTATTMTMTVKVLKRTRMIALKVHNCVQNKHTEESNLTAKQSKAE